MLTPPPFPTLRTDLSDAFGPGGGTEGCRPAAEAPGSSQPSGGDGGRGRQPPRVLLKAPTIDTAITKSTPALQQICEEEEEIGRAHV